MPDKPTTAAGDPPDQVARVKSTCLYLATKLGDLMPELVVVGGLVPSLLIDQQNLPENVTPHVGTMDLDLGLAFALVGEARYQEVATRLRNAKFAPDKNDQGQGLGGKNADCERKSLRNFKNCRTTKEHLILIARKRNSSRCATPQRPGDADTDGPPGQSRNQA